MDIQKLIITFNKTRTQILILLVLVLISYFNILRNDFSFDDHDFFVNWPTVQDSASGLSAFLSLPDLLAGELPSNHRGVYRPVRSVLYLLNLKIWGINPFIFHLQAIIVHFLITLTIYFIIKIMLKNKKQKIIAFIGAALFAVHPIHTEAITYTAASFDSVGILFFFASFHFYVRAGEKAGDKKSSLLLSGLLAFLAFFTYEMTLVLPFLILLYEVCFKKLNLKNYRKLTPLLPYLAILGSYLIIRFVLLHIGNRGDYLGPAYAPASNQAKLGIFEILFTYIYLLIFPLKLTITYAVPTGLFPIFYKTVTSIDPSGKLLENIGRYIYIFPPVVIITLLALIFRFFKRNSIVAFSLGWFLISLIPILNLIPQGAVMAERYLYIPSFGFCLLLSYLIYKLLNSSLIKLKGNSKIILGSLLIITILSLLGFRTIMRNFDWNDRESIYKSALRDEPNNFVAFAALGAIKLDQKNYDEVISYSKSASALNPDAPDVYHRLAIAYEEKGDFQKAIEEYEKLIKVESRYVPAYFGLASIYQKQNKYDLAITNYQKVLEIEPDNFDAHFNLGGIYYNKKDYMLALKEYGTIIDKRPNQADIYNNLGNVYEQTGDLKKAIIYYQKAVNQAPTNYYFLINLAKAYEKNSEFQNAINAYEKAITIKPEEKTIQDKIDSLKSSRP